MTSYQQPYATGSDPSLSGGPSANEDPSMKDKATEAVDQGREAAGQVAQTAVEHAQEVKDEAVKQARDLVGEARQHVSSQVGDQHQNLVSNLRSLSSELGSMVEGSQQSGTATELVSQARDRVDGVANWLDGRQPADLLDEVRTFARRRPGTFLIGALAAGLVAGRMTRGAVAAHSEGLTGSSGDGAHSVGSGSPSTTTGDQTATYEPGGGYAHTTGQAGFEAEEGSAGGYSMGGSYGEAADQPGPEQGYGSTSTYGDGGTAPYPAAGYQNGGPQR